MLKERTYQENFIAAVKMVMANEVLDSTKAVAEYLGISYMSLWKVMDGSNKPTVDQGILICKKGGFSANWLFLNVGEIYYKQELELTKLMKELKSIRKDLTDIGVMK